MANSKIKNIKFACVYFSQHKHTLKINQQWLLGSYYNFCTSCTLVLKYPTVLLCCAYYLKFIVIPKDIYDLITWDCHQIFHRRALKLANRSSKMRTVKKGHLLHHVIFFIQVFYLRHFTLYEFNLKESKTSESETALDSF